METLTGLLFGILLFIVFYFNFFKATLCKKYLCKHLLGYSILLYLCSMSLQHWELLAVFILGLLSWVTTFYKQNKGNKVTAGISIMLTEIYSKDKLKSNLKDTIQEVAIESIRNNSYLHPKHKDIMTNWSESFETFFINAYFTKYRGKSSIEDYLSVKSDSLISELENYTVQTIPEKIKAGTKIHTIIDYLKADSGIYEEIDLLIRRLVKNGLNEEGYVSLAEDFTRNLMSKGTKAFINWDRTTKIKQNGSINN